MINKYIFLFLLKTGILLIEREKYEEALKQFIKASNLDKNEIEYLRKIAFCYQQLKNYPEANKYYLKCIQFANKQNKNISQYNVVYARYLNEEIGDYDEAEKYYKQAIKVEQDAIDDDDDGNKKSNYFGEYLMEYAELLKTLKRYKETIKI